MTTRNCSAAFRPTILVRVLCLVGLMLQRTVLNWCAFHLRWSISFLQQGSRRSYKFGLFKGTRTDIESLRDRAVAALERANLETERKNMKQSTTSSQAKNKGRRGRSCNVLEPAAITSKSDRLDRSPTRIGGSGSGDARGRTPMSREEVSERIKDVLPSDARCITLHSPSVLLCPFRSSCQCASTGNGFCHSLS